jgi:hypothetical protein
MFRHGRSASRAVLLLQRTCVVQMQRKQQLQPGFQRSMRPQVFTLSTHSKSYDADNENNVSSTYFILAADLIWTNTLCNVQHSPSQLQQQLPKRIRKQRQCEELSCTKQSTFGFVADGVARYCLTDKQDFMVDVTHNKCAHEGCHTRPNMWSCSRRQSNFLHGAQGAIHGKRCRPEVCSGRL